MVSVREVFIGLKKKRLGIEGSLSQPDSSIRIEFNAWFFSGNRESAEKEAMKKYWTTVIYGN
jgi:hypothetical protein